MDTERDELVKKFHRFEKQKHSTVVPKAFTEKGLYMLATILKSPKAVETTIAIVEAYAKLKELSRVIVEVPQYEDKSTEQQVLLHRGGAKEKNQALTLHPYKCPPTDAFDASLHIRP